MTMYEIKRAEFAEIANEIAVQDDVYVLECDYEQRLIKFVYGGYLWCVKEDAYYQTIVYESDIYVERDSTLPMWGWMWAFGDVLDDEWLDRDENLRVVADCGFRIYKQEDMGYLFGIDGAGYDFYGEHWIPLYKARGLR